MHPFNRILAVAISIAAFLSSCGGEKTDQPENNPAPVADQPAQPSFKLFEMVSATQSGINFNNPLKEDDNINFFRWDYLYNGGGVAIGDINNDGLPDLYFTGTLSPDHLYLNKGDLKFEDISPRAGINGFPGIKTGVTMADVNQDGWLDIFVCRSGLPADRNLRENLLFINNGNAEAPSFTESAAAYGLNDPANSVQSAFFDYDRDGDLDCYVTSHPKFRMSYDDMLQGIAHPSDDERDKLYRNEGNGTFKEVARQSGIENWGHGLGLCISDINRDGWPDIYVANDFQIPDFMYINNGDGTFSESLKQGLPHCSYFSMGCDIADVDNDGRPEIMVVEMLAPDNKRQKTNMASMNPEKFWKHVDMGFHYQYMRNAFHYNQGNLDDARHTPFFTDIADFSGVAKTDWSWAPLLVDFDHDGDKDLVISNGYLKDTQDKDYMKKSDEIAAKKQGKIAYQELQQLLPATRIKNVAFRNNGDRTFTKVSAEWGFDYSGFSNGMAYADLDNDGDLDLAINNLNETAVLLKNNLMENGGNPPIRIQLKGPQGNRNGIGTKVTLKSEKAEQYQEMQPVRGFQSSNENVLHFAMKPGDALQEIRVEWPDGKVQIKKGTVPGTEVLLDYAMAVPAKSPPPPPKQLFAAGRQVGWSHEENPWDDYKAEILLPHKQSQNGPALATADIDGDGRDDFFIGGAAGQAGAMMLQQADGSFKPRSGPWSESKAAEDVGGCFFDADGDGDLDLYVVSGGNEFPASDPLLQDRLYFNDGKGGFSKAPATALPKMLSSGGCAAAADYDGDGDLDLFVGGRIVPGKYPLPAQSFLLQNDGRGNFKDVAAQIAPDLSAPGLVTDAAWSDFDGDGKPDLVLTGEWMPVTLLKNEGGKFVNKTADYGLAESVGWWYKVEEADLDGDGDMDFVLGNLGTNYKYQASPEEPFHVYCDDFDQSGNLDIVLGYYNEKVCYPVRGRQCSSEQMPFIKEKYHTYAEFGTATIQDIYGDKLNEALHYAATNFSSSVLMNEGGKFVLKSLPGKAQFAPVKGIIVHDFDGDGTSDLLLAGNHFVAEVETPRADGGIGLLLKGDGKGGFAPVPYSESGFLARGDVRGMSLLQAGSGPPLVVVANNDARPQVFKVQSSKGLPISMK